MAPWLVDVVIAWLRSARVAQFFFFQSPVFSHLVELPSPDSKFPIYVVPWLVDVVLA